MCCCIANGPCITAWNKRSTSPSVLNRNITTGGVDKDGNKIGDVKEKVFHNHNLHVLTDAREHIEGEQDILVDKDSSAMYGANRYVDIEQQEVITADSITLSAMTSITLMAGASSIVIDATGVTVLGVPMINLNPLGAVPPMPPTPPVVVNPDDPDS